MPYRLGVDLGTTFTAAAVSDGSTEPTVIVPRTIGVDVFTGGPPTTVGVAFEAAVREPSAFVAVTRTRIRKPTSAPTSR